MEASERAPALAAAPCNALVLAGRRAGPDAVADATGLADRALVPVGGEPMLARVLRALLGLDDVAHVRVSFEPSGGLGEPLDGWLRSGAFAWSPVEKSPSASVLAAWDALGDRHPLLLTTADHPLLTTPMLEDFRRVARGSRADLVVGVVSERVVRSRYPEAVRTFVPLRGERVTGANLFWLRTANARRPVAFWEEAGRLRKQPWRLVSQFGAGSLLRFALRRLDLEAALERASRVMGARVEAVRLPFPECAIDVDRPADLALAERIVAGRAGGPASATERGG